MIQLETSIPEILLFEPKVFIDERGCFFETFNLRIIEALGGHAFVQDNESQSKQGVLRGLHYQLRRPQGKLLRVVQGEIFDVAVDMRKTSPTFGKWTSAILSGENKRILWVPSGFAHGFLTLSSSAVLAYKCTDVYSPKDERTLIWDDPTLSVRWPLDDIEGKPLLSPKDLLGVPFLNAEVYP